MRGAYGSLCTGSPTPEDYLISKITVSRVLLALILLYGGLLRFEAMTRKWGPVEGPAWSRQLQLELQTVASHIRPPALGWAPEPFLEGDPYDDLQSARDMRGFYEASGREPVFIFTTKVFQRLVGQQHVAVCLASGLFSVLIVWATYLLGSYAFSKWVGLAAALGMAIERDVISVGVLGFRDDAFVFFVLLSAYGVLRSRERASRGNHLLCGLALAGACLTRITAITLVVPAIGYLALPSSAAECRQSRAWLPRLRVKSAVIVALIVAAAVSPFLINCWLAFGDPLFSLHDRTRSFQQWFDLPAEGPMSPSRYLVVKASRMPVSFAETVVNGFTTYPFDHKWKGFDVWLSSYVRQPGTETQPHLVRALEWLTLVGLVSFLWSPAGRLLLLVLFSSMVPYVFTWQTPRILELHHFRYTLQAYPIYLMAATFAVERAIALARLLSLERFVSNALLQKRLLLRTSAMLAVIVAGWGVLNVFFPYLRLEEELRLNSAAVLQAGARDRLFFRWGWSPRLTVGNVTARFAQGRSATVWVPMVQGHAHTMTLRLDPFVFPGAPAQRVNVRVNGVRAASFTLGWNPERVGEYSFELPASVVTKSLGRVDLVASYSTPVGSVRRPSPVEQRRANASFDDLVADDLDVSFRLWAIVVFLKP